MTAPTPEEIRQYINNGEIGGEMHERVLHEKLMRLHGLTQPEAALAVDDAWAAGFVKRGFWDAANWGPEYPERVAANLAAVRRCRAENIAAKRRLRRTPKRSRRHSREPWEWDVFRAGDFFYLPRRRP